MSPKNPSKTPNMAKPLILAVVLCTLGGFTYWLQFAKKPKDEKAEAESKKVFALNHAAIARFEIGGVSVKAGLETKPPLAVALECRSLAEKLCHSDDPSHWDLVEPLKTKADDTTVDSLLKNLGNLVLTDTVDLTPETPEKRAQLLKDYLLDASFRANPATRRMTFKLEGGGKVVAYFGVKSPIGEGTFALVEKDGKIDENRVLIVPDWQLSVFDQKTSYFRNKALFGFTEKDVSTFSILTSPKTKAPVTGKVSGDGKTWSIALGTGPELAADPDAISGLLSGIAILGAKDVVSENHESAEAKASLAGTKMIYEVKLSLKSGDKHLRIYEKTVKNPAPKTPVKNPKLAPPAVATVNYAMVDGVDPLFEIDPMGVKNVAKSFEELRVGKLLNTGDRYAVTAIDLDVQGGENYTKLVAKDSTGHWKVGSLETAPGKIENLLDRLSSKIVIAYSGPAPSGDFMKMTLRKTEGPKDAAIAEIEFWSVKDHLYARNLADPKKETLELRADFAKDLPWHAAMLTSTGEKTK